MPRYLLLLHPAVKKDLRKIDTAAAHHIRDAILPIIADDPQRGLPLRGKLRGLRKHVVRHKGVSYRVVYEVEQSNHRIIVLHIGPRGEFYERLERRLG